MTTTAHSRIVYLLRQGYTVAKIAELVEVTETEVRRVMSLRGRLPQELEVQAKAAKAARTRLSDSERAVALLRREGHDERVIRANFPEA